MSRFHPADRRQLLTPAYDSSWSEAEAGTGSLLGDFTTDQPTHFTLRRCDQDDRKPQHRQRKDNPDDRYYHESRKRN